MTIRTLTNQQKYDNLLVLHPDGTPMFKGSRKAVDWYLKRGLAVQLNQKTYQLTFQPNGYGKGNDNEFFLDDLQNQCVVCGEVTQLARSFIVPHCYREALHKTRDHYDVLLTCLECHDTYDSATQYFKQKLADLFKAPLNGWAPNEKAEREAWNNKVKLSSYAHCLLKYSDKIPAGKQNKMREEMANWLGKEVKDKDLPQLAIKPTGFKLTNWVSHGELVVRKLSSISEFEEDWRQFFVDCMDPQFLPEHWKIVRDD